MKRCYSITCKLTTLILTVCVNNTAFGMTDIDTNLIELVTKKDWGHPVKHWKPDDEAINCRYHKREDKTNSHYMKCGKGYSCFNMVYSSYVNKTFSGMNRNQGCLPEFLAAQVDDNCSKDKCLFPNLQPALTANRTKSKFLSFCCCTGNLCNMDNVYVQSHVEISTPSTFLPTMSSSKKSSNNSTLVLTMIVSISTLVFFVICLILLYCWKHKQKGTLTNQQLSRAIISQRVSDDCSNISVNAETLDTLLHGNLIHQGMHSAIRLGQFGDKTVAVKILPPRSKKQWYNEKEIYRMVGPHPNIAQFITCNNFHDGVSFEGVIVISYFPCGSLLNYLRNYVLTWKHMIRLAYSVANGLAFLHGESDFDNGCYSRPSIAHQDLNSRNILVKNDGTCVLADFGFALRLAGNPPENFPLVGSPRYMAPEVLDGSIVLTNWTSALKQVDCYALGLLLWELARRCHEICQPDAIVPECLLPYEEELGKHPSVNKVRQYVCVNKQRPTFPDQWNKTDFTLSHLMTLIQECWDQDGNARLTSLCVLNRITQLQDTASAEQRIYQETLARHKICLDDLDFNEKPRRTSSSILYVDYTEVDEEEETVFSETNQCLL